MIKCLDCGKVWPDFTAEIEGAVPEHSCTPRGHDHRKAIKCLKCHNHFPDEGNGIPSHDCIPQRGDPVDHPDHYCVAGYECIEVIKVLKLGYLAGSAFKYLWRYQYKGKPLQDLKKARVFLDHLIKQHEDSGQITFKNME